MIRIGLEEGVLLVGELLDLGWESAIARPETRSREVLQSSVHLPDL